MTELSMQLLQLAATAGVAWGGVKMSLNGMRSDVSDIKQDVKDIKRDHVAHAERITRLEAGADR